MKTTLVNCGNCGILFPKENRYINQANKRKQKSLMCSRSCSTIYGNKTRDYRPPKGVMPPNLNPGNNLDEYSPFKQHLINIRHHTKNKEILVTITIEDIKKQWEKQGGRCPYTGLPLYNPKTTRGHGVGHRPSNRASVDRIDPNKGYTPDNIEFVSLMANLAKNGWTKQEVIDFCVAVSKNLGAKG